MFAKGSKKDPSRWRFDTSSDNLSCFIRKRSKMASESSPVDRVPRAIRKRGKSNKGKPVNFQNEAFFESILANTFTEEFAGTEDIRELVKKLKLSEDEDSSPDDRAKIKQRKQEQIPGKNE